MLPILLKPAVLNAAEAATWAWYGARTALQMLGLAFCEATAHGSADTLVIDPQRGQICLRCDPQGNPPSLAAADLLQVTHRAVFRPGLAGETDLPLFGPVTAQPIQSPLAAQLVASSDGHTVGEFMTMTEEGDGWRLNFNCQLFATLGLYLSRFSWPGNTSFKGFVRQIDDLWDCDLAPRYARRAVVNEYLQVLAGILGNLYGDLGLPLATCWPHPHRNGQVMLHGLIITHDVDQLFPDASYRSRLDQTGNPRFGLPQWRALEDRLGVRSAHYFYSPKPGVTYWQDPNYCLTDPAVAAEIQALIAGGWEVSPHQLSHDDREALLGEHEYFAQAIGQPSTGTRTHYLKHTFETLSYKAEAGLAYDTTWYAEQTESGFLCGSALPYRPLDCATLEPVGLWEFPFVVEDGIAFGVYGQGTARDVDGAVADGALAFDQVLAHDGYACLNWHNYTFEQMAGSGTSDSWPPALEGLVQYLRCHSPALWVPLPIELARWCSRRERIGVEAQPGRLLVRNEGTEDCPDAVVCLQYPLGRAPSLPPQWQSLGQRGSRELYGLPVAVPSGETLVVPVP